MGYGGNQVGFTWPTSDDTPTYTLNPFYPEVTHQGGQAGLSVGLGNAAPSV